MIRAQLDLALVDHALLDALEFVGAVNKALDGLRPGHGKEAMDGVMGILTDAEQEVCSVLEQECPGEGW